MAQISIEAYRKIFVAGVLLLILIIIIAFGLRFFLGEEVAITIDTIPQGASVEFKGETYKTPVTLREVKIGDHTAKLSKVGYFERKEKITVSKDSNRFLFRLYTLDTSPSVLSTDLAGATEISQSDFEKILKFLPHRTYKFWVEALFSGGKTSVVITVHAIFNKPSQYENYKKQLNQRSKEALDWIRSKGVDPENLDIIWKPRDPGSFN